MWIRLTVAAIVLTVAGAAIASAVEPDEMLDDPVLEGRARDISKNLRCLVCQNQSIDDSDAPLARDLRTIVRQRLVAGDSNDQVTQFVVDRYGDYVLLQPPVKPATYPLWFGPAIILLAAAAGLAVIVRRRRGSTGPEALSAREEARVRELLDDNDPGA